MIITNFKQLLKNFRNIPGIYKFRFLTNKNKLYIGEADDIYDRIVNQYRDEIKSLTSKTIRRPIIKAIKKYGWTNIEIEIIDYGEHLRDKDTRIALETACILEYDTLIQNKNGYNVLLVGFNRKGIKHSRETCIKMSINSAKNNLGKKFSKEWCKKISDSRKKLYKNGWKDPKTKKVIQINKDTNEIIKIWDSSQEATKFLLGKTTKYNCKNIKECCNKRQKTAYGFKWEFVE